MTFSIETDTEDSFITTEWGKNCGIKNPEVLTEHAVNSTRPWIRLDPILHDEIERWLRTTSGNCMIRRNLIKFLYEDEEIEYKLRFL